MEPSDSTPWPMTRQPQWSQVGASTWIAHSKLSKTCVAPCACTSKALSYSFPQTSQTAMRTLLVAPVGIPAERPPKRRPLELQFPSGFSCSLGSAVAAPSGGERLHRFAVDLIGRDHGDAGGRTRPQGRSPPALADDGALAEDRARPDLRDLLAVHHRGEHAVEQQVELIGRLVLLDEPLVLSKLASRQFGSGLQEVAGELALECALGLGHERLRILVAPGRVLAVGLPVPGLEVDRSRLLDEAALAVVDPVAGKRARSHELMVGGAVGPNRERERRPRRRRVDPEERTALHPPRCWEAGAAAHGLDEARFPVTNLGLWLQGLERNSLENKVLGPETEGRRTDETAAFVAVTDDLAVLDLDPGPELIRLPKAICLAQPLEVALLEPIRRRLVVMADAELERDLGHALDGFRGNPGDCCDRRLDAHETLLVVGATLDDSHLSVQGRPTSADLILSRVSLSAVSPPFAAAAPTARPRGRSCSRRRAARTGGSAAVRKRISR